MERPRSTRDRPSLNMQGITSAASASPAPREGQEAADGQQAECGTAADGRAAVAAIVGMLDSSESGFVITL